MATSSSPSGNTLSTSAWSAPGIIIIFSPGCNWKRTRKGNYFNLFMAHELSEDYFPSKSLSKEIFFIKFEKFRFLCSFIVPRFQGKLFVLLLLHKKFTIVDFWRVSKHLILSALIIFLLFGSYEFIVSISNFNL